MSHPSIAWKLLVACSLLAVATSAAEAQEAPGIKWRTSYNAARKEAESKNLPMLIDFIMVPYCFYCDKMDKHTFSDPRVASTINQKFIPLKLNNDADGTLAEALKVKLYPTIFVASPDGRIMHTKVGFIEADAMHEVLQQTIQSLTPSDAMQDKFLAAMKHEAAGEYARAISGLRDVVEDGKNRPVQIQAQEMLKKLEKRAADRLAAARELHNKGQAAEAHEAYAEIQKQFPGMPASREAADLSVQIAKTNTDVPAAQRNKRARDLLLQAKDFYQSKDYVPCLDRCDIILANYGDLPEGRQAFSLASEIKNNPVWMQNAAAVLTDRLGGLYLALADTSLKQGDVRQARDYLQKVVTTFPGTRLAESAQIRLTQLQGTVPARPDVQTTRP